ncbi:CehA/McbA family metallohydrolase [Couchioplanes caeruleus]|uniref:CehA/McbA family metallohydrolase n=1 Tax=Couchioplanes caeruleus TaxID=56438 RepID=UPI00201C8EC5|nr:CehA/McbA family metallohydrolase [Couchioplanes caeruleus]UQU68581.1 CehA/McbA family metallohydrolase [Couchioplanes caeruleus]
MRWYRGDCHLHSQRSHGGELTPAEVVAAAREAGLDFVAVTEHNTTETYPAWSALAGDDLLVIAGQEATTTTGHWLALGLPPGHVVDWRYGVRDDRIGEQVRGVHEHGGVCVVAHPHAPYPSGTFMFPLNGFDVIEVWNGLWTSALPWNADNEAAVAEWGRSLAAGVHAGDWRPAVGNSDTHLRGQVAVPHTVVLAEELSVEAVLAGIRAGRSWVAGSPGIQLSFTVTAGDRTGDIGATVRTDGRAALARVAVEGVPAGTVRFLTDRGRVHQAELPGGAGWETTAEESAYVRVEVRHPNGHMAALTNPIILG